MNLLDQVGKTEKVLWHGRKQTKASFWDSVFNPLWLIVLLFSLTFVLASVFIMISNNGKMDLKTVLFFIMFGPWIPLYLINVLTAPIRAKHTEYCVTNSGVYMQKGVFRPNVQKKRFTEAESVSLHRTPLFDQKCGTGDIVLKLFPGDMDDEFVIANVPDCEQVFQLVQQQFEAAVNPSAAEMLRRLNLPQIAEQTANAADLSQTFAASAPDDPMEAFGNPAAEQHAEPQQQPFGQAPDF